MDLFDHRVSMRLQRPRHGKPEGTGGPRVDQEIDVGLEPGGLLAGGQEDATGV